MKIIYRYFLIIFSYALMAFPVMVIAQSATEADWQQGLSSYERFIVYPHLEKGFRAMQNDKTDEAIKEFLQAHNLAENQLQIILYLANAYDKNQNFVAAINLLKKALVKEPKRQDLQQALSQAQTKLIAQTLNYAQTLSSNKDELSDFLSKNHPIFTQAYDEYGWIQLLSLIADKKPKPLLSYEPKFHQNKIFQIEEIINYFLTTGNQKQTTKFIDRMSQTIASDPHAIDQISYQLMNHNAANQAMHLLLNAYPFNNTDPGIRQILLDRLALAQAGTSNKNLLLNFVLTKKPVFNQAAQEKEWLELLSICANEQPKVLLNYQSQFESNKKLQAELVLNHFENTSGKISASQVATFLPFLKKLTPPQIDLLSFKLDQQNNPDQALALLMNHYPFRDASPAIRHALIDRLGVITERNPKLLTQHEIARLSVPLDSPAMRSKQSVLLEALKNCDGVERVLEDYSDDYAAEDWIRLGSCYQQQNKSGLAQFAYARAYAKHPNVQTARILAYQSFETKDYPVSLAMWKIVISSEQFSTADLKAATYTAVAADQLILATEWLKDYEAKDGNHNDEYWWLKTVTTMQSNPAQAMSDIKSAIALQPRVEYFETLASLQTKSGNDAEAIKSLNQALALNPENSSVQASLGYAYYHQKKLALAEKHLDQALTMRPDDNRLTEQLAYVNQQLGQNNAALSFTERAIDNDDLYTRAEITPEIEINRFGLRRMHEDLTRRWTFSVDAISGNQIASVPNAPQPGLNYKSYGQAELAYRLGNPAIDDGKTISAFARVFAGNGSMNASLPIYAPVLAAGLRWKPFSSQVINFSVEEQIPLDQGESATTNTLLRASASFFNSGKYSDEWHPAAKGWPAQNLYLDAAYYVVNRLSSLTADYRVSYHNKLGESQTLEPYTHIQWNALNQQTDPDIRAGMGVRWNIWGNESHYNAYASKISIGLEFQYAISTYLSDKTTVLLTLGGRW